MAPAPLSPALLMIDVQMAFVHDRDAGYPWANPEAEARIADLLAAFRAAGLPVIHIHHHGLDPRDTMHATAPGAVVQPCAAPVGAEPVVVKHGASAFIGTDLAQRLAALGNPALVLAGGAANVCVESTARMAGNLGFSTTVVADALINFQKTLRDGRVMPPADVLALTLANLDGEFARITDTATVLAEIAG
ncbi:isochorismatase family protein [Rhodobacter ferrooxidans]|uniref:Isochorismatase hydrolase n=1 Tax=Rhodobacter ferrooxidans TaxID=371731 RepID=C8RZS5_9RHOB|nr:isochorismatase family protein [Rhodobacter sp. SW2]EEW25872.1 isochorismatase hydrolase [Rhodobacter sp. SW2]